MQGFCCGCGSGETNDAVTGERTRAGRLCNWYAQPDSAHINARPDSAQCMRLTGNWWEMYTPGAVEMDVEIDVTVNTAAAASTTLGTDNNSVLSLTPADPADITADAVISAQVVQPVESYFAFPDISAAHKVLLRKSPAEYIVSDDIVVLDDDLVSVSGNECNKVGTYFGAFRCVLPTSSSYFSQHKCLPPISTHNELIDWRRFQRISVIQDALSQGAVYIVQLHWVCQHVFGHTKREVSEPHGDKYFEW